jgi:(+)-trans-carveol dehydrogenase
MKLSRTSARAALECSWLVMSIAYSPIMNPGPDDVAPVAQMMHVLPIGWVEPEDISNAIVFLSSDEGRYVTGVTLPVDGGALLK